MKVSIVIPVADDSRNQYLENLLAALKKQTFDDFEIILVIGDHRQGRAINKGVREAQGHWIVTLDDDTQIEDDRLLEKLVKAMESDDSIGLGGAACVIPEWATSFQKKAMQQIPRRYFPIQDQTIESDFVQHPCLILSKELFMQIGGEDEELIRGLDPILRQKVRDAGRKVCVIADTAVVHLLPDRISKIFSMYRRNGRGSVFAHKFFPNRVLELTHGYDEGAFIKFRPLWFRIMRRLGNILRSFLRANWIRQVSDMAYILGWVEGWILGEFPEIKGPITYQEEESQEGIRKIRVVKKTNSIEEQIARMHISSEIDFILGDQDHHSLKFYRDKVGVFRNYAGDGFLVETDENSEVLGFLMLLLAPGSFRKELIKKGYPFRYLMSILTGRYRGAQEGWKKWLRLPLAFLRKPTQAPDAGGAKIVAFVVREDLRGKGIGSKLLKRAQDLTLGWHLHHLSVTVHKENKGALRLYERHGFKIAGQKLESTGASWYLTKPIGVP